MLQESSAPPYTRTRAGILFQNKKGQWVPYARSEIGIDDPDKIFHQRFVVPTDDPRVPPPSSHHTL